MNVEIISQDKECIELKMDNQTVAEILRVYLNENDEGVKFAAWRKEHPSKPIVFRIESSGKTARKAVSEAVAAVKKDTDKILKGLKTK